MELLSLLRASQSAATVARQQRSVGSLITRQHELVAELRSELRTAEEHKQVNLLTLGNRYKPQFIISASGYWNFIHSRCRQASHRPKRRGAKSACAQRATNSIAGAAERCRGSDLIFVRQCTENGQRIRPAGEGAAKSDDLERAGSNREWDATHTCQA